MKKIKDIKQHICLDIKYIKCFFGISRHFLIVNAAACTALETLLDTHRAAFRKNINLAFGLKRRVMIQMPQLKPSFVPSQVCMLTMTLYFWLRYAARNQDWEETGGQWCSFILNTKHATGYLNTVSIFNILCKTETNLLNFVLTPF